ncbi:YfcZ/YiiS family protein [Vibrio sp. TH_r3]|uniref:YfcZ/YiiS family protein n=1 Tax=Vibrio sp. TH_r3 TaxID=3082084 RepID=UPI002952A778|nr:YfcZ/YiiS family protein [Vibrio sp. TH_r3]MDV7103437.1 YfcZ/YiiS family protein [Vibrio sp. TH_r3]
MSEKINNLNAENELCEACGVTAEVGFIIAEGDEVAEVSVFGDSKQNIQTEFEKYLALAKQVCENVIYETTPIDDQTTELHAKFKFEVSAEKLIFELKSRSIG